MGLGGGTVKLQAPKEQPAGAVLSWGAAWLEVLPAVIWLRSWKGGGRPPLGPPNFLDSPGFFRAFSTSHKGNIKIALDSHLKEVMKPSINQQIIQGRYFMFCCFYSHLKGDVKATGKSWFLSPTSGPQSWSRGLTPVFPEVPASVPAQRGPGCWGCL